MSSRSLFKGDNLVANNKKSHEIEAIPVTLLTGFLGSGKTTVLNYLLQQAGMSNSAVIVNEFGEIGLDHELVVGGKEDMVLLNNGCLCCTVRGDLVNTLRDLMMVRMRGDVPPFDRVLIETTGLADPAPILHTLMGDDLTIRYFRLDGVVTSVDAVNGMSTLDAQFESIKQVAVADRLLITKTDLIDSTSLKTLYERLKEINPAARKLEVVNGAVEPKELFGIGLYNPEEAKPDVIKWLKEEAYNEIQGHSHGHDVNRHDDKIRAFCVTFDEPIRLDAVEQWFDLIMLLKGPDLLRVKGIINVDELSGPVVIHGVQHVFHPPVELESWDNIDKRTRIVFITRDVEQKILEDTLKNFAGRPTNLLSANN
ncbi:MAG: GTP-binding protein [Rhodospirillales bacterium]|nr:GTP-binding protein [Rhodospirillales bacterium]